MEPCSHDLGGVLGTDPGRLRYIYGWSLHHRLQGGVGVPALEAH
jgi:hypothetical protein